jgi:hypothetical protein
MAPGEQFPTLSTYSSLSKQVFPVARLFASSCSRHATSRVSIMKPIQRKNDWGLPDGSTGMVIWDARVLPMTGHEVTMEGQQPLRDGAMSTCWSLQSGGYYVFAAVSSISLTRTSPGTA